MRNEDKTILIEGGAPTVDKLVAYKFMQYLNVVYKKTHVGSRGYDSNLDGYTCDDFYKSFLKILLGIPIIDDGVDFDEATWRKLESFHGDVENIMENKNNDYDILGDFPKDLKKAKWATICETYDLTFLYNNHASTIVSDNE